MIKSIILNYIYELIRPKSALSRLMLANIGVYFLLLIARLFVNLFDFLFQTDGFHHGYSAVIDYLSCPASFEMLLFQPLALVTSLFLHTSFWHFLFNMIVLNFAGKIFRYSFSNKHLLILYIAGGAFGNLLYMLSYNYFPAFQDLIQNAYALGASGAIMALLFAATVKTPKHEIRLFLLGRMQLLWLSVLFVAIDVLTIPYGNAGGHIAHIGGAFAGIAFAVILHSNIFAKKTKLRTKRKKYTVSSNYKSAGRPMSDEEYNAQKVTKEKMVDAILDKISKNGYEALSKSEKEFLFKNKL